MSPQEAPIATTDDNLSTAVQLALLNQRIGHVVDVHDKRISALERWRENRGKATSAVISTVATVVAVLLTVVTLLQWR